VFIFENSNQFEDVRTDFLCVADAVVSLLWMLKGIAFRIVHVNVVDHAVFTFKFFFTARLVPQKFSNLRTKYGGRLYRLTVTKIG